MNNELPERNSFIWIIIVMGVIFIGIGVWLLVRDNTSDDIGDINNVDTINNVGTDDNVATDTIFDIIDSERTLHLIEYPVLEDYENTHSSEYSKTYNKDDVNIMVSAENGKIKKHFNELKKHFSQDSENYRNVEFSEIKELKLGDKVYSYMEMLYDDETKNPHKKIWVCTEYEGKYFFEVEIFFNNKEIDIDNFKIELTKLLDIKVYLISDLISENSILIDNKNIVEYKVPEGLKLLPESREKGKVYSKDDVEITVGAGTFGDNVHGYSVNEYLDSLISGMEEGYGSYTKISEIKEMKIGDRECYYIQASIDFTEFIQNRMSIVTRLSDEYIYEVHIVCKDKEIPTDILNKLLDVEVKPIK